jgi:hypothetical protein
MSCFLLLPRLAKAGYIEAGRTPGLFNQAHKTNSIKKFALVVDHDFLVKSCWMGSQADQSGSPLQTTLREHYTVTVDKKASRFFCGITLEWDYTPQEKGKLPYQCQVMWKRHSRDSPTPNLPSTNLPPANGHPLNMEPRSNMLPLLMITLEP